MINVHLNGDLIRCPDISEIHKRGSEIRDKHNICCYGYLKYNCECFLQSLKEDKKIKKVEPGRSCPYSGCLNCSGHKLRVEHGKKEKTYSINNQVYRKISSASHLMVKISENKILFVTLTLPPFKYKQFKKCKNGICQKIFESEINRCFSKFIHNLHENYGCRDYIAVKEYCPSSGRPHFHLLFSLRFTSFIDLNSAWCSALSDICFSSKNAFTSKKGSVIIRNPGRALRYACKYFAKNRGSRNNTRLVFVSNNLLSHSEKSFITDASGVVLSEVKKRVSNIVKHEYYNSINDILENYKSISILQTSDYSTRFRITDNFDFDRFCTNYLYNLFDLKQNNTDFEGLPGSLN